VDVGLATTPAMFFGIVAPGAAVGHACMHPWRAPVCSAPARPPCLRAPR
jgi:hypothetical protein